MATNEISECELDRKLDAAKLAYENEDYDSAFKLYVELSEIGCDICYTILGWLYFAGKGVKQSDIEAKLWLTKAAEKGDPEGQFYLAKLFWKHKDYDQIVKWLKKAADQSYSPAIYRLGRLYEDGLLVTTDIDKAASYYHQAASMGHVFGENRYGLMLIKRSHGFTNIPKGIFLYIRSFLKGIVVAWKEPLNESIRT